MLDSAVEHYTRQQRVVLAGILRAQKARGRGTDEVAKVIAAYQILATREAMTGLNNMLDEQGLAGIAADATPSPSALIGVSSAGMPLQEMTRLAPSGPGVFDMIVATQLQDVARNMMGLGIVSRPRFGYVRQISANACSRCAVLGGRFYRYSSGFLRHPQCNCRNIPTREGESEGLTTTPDEYFRSLSPGRQDEVFTKAGAQALRDGADMSQVVNVYRRTAGMQFAQVSPIKRKVNLDGTVDKFTTEGTTKRGVAGKAQQRLRVHGPHQMRLMPESIYLRAKDRTDALRLLRLYGYII